MIVYHGVCEGGPWDGKRHENERPVVEIHILPPDDVGVWDLNCPADEKLTYKTGVYYFDRGVWRWNVRAGTTEANAPDAGAACLPKKIPPV